MTTKSITVGKYLLFAPLFVMLILHNPLQSYRVIAQDPKKAVENAFQEGSLRLIDETPEEIKGLAIGLTIEKTEVKLGENLEIQYFIKNSGAVAGRYVISIPAATVSNEITYAVAVFDEEGRIVINLSGMRSPGKVMQLQDANVFKYLPGESRSFMRTWRAGDFEGLGYCYGGKKLRTLKAGKYYVQFQVLDRFTAEPPFSLPFEQQKNSAIHERQSQLAWRQFLADHPGKVIAASKPIELKVLASD